MTICPPAVRDRREHDDQGRLSLLEQQGWVIQYLAYGQQEGTDLPSRLSVENDQVRVKLIVDRWERRSPLASDYGG